MTKFIRAQLIFNPSANEWHLHTRRGRSYFVKTRAEAIDAAQAGLPEGYTLKLTW